MIEGQNTYFLTVSHLLYALDANTMSPAMSVLPHMKALVSNAISRWLPLQLMQPMNVIVLQVLNFDSPRGGISLETEKSRTGTTSKLLVTRAGTRDSGNYTCLPSRGEAVSADVHVITGETRERGSVGN